MSPKIPLTFACGPYHHMSALDRGEIKPTGIDLNYLSIDHPRDVFERMMPGLEFDASEMSASDYICQHAAGNRTLIAIPVFPSRAFRHSFIVVNERSVKQPSDLNGKRIGIPLYNITAAVWIRGLLQHSGVDLETITWVEGALEKPGLHGKSVAKPLLRPVKREQNVSGKSLSQLLEDGEIDATIGADLPSCLGKSPHIKRLFPNFKDAEKTYYRSTGIFPIMHLVVIRRDVLDKWPFVATSLFNACNDSKAAAMRQMRFLVALRFMLPWLPADVDEIDEVFAGGDPWVYGLEANRKTLEALVGFMFGQGMIEREMPIEELFAPVRGPNWKD